MSSPPLPPAVPPPSKRLIGVTGGIAIAVCVLVLALSFRGRLSEQKGSLPEPFPNTWERRSFGRMSFEAPFPFIPFEEPLSEKAREVVAKMEVKQNANVNYKVNTFVTETVFFPGVEFSIEEQLAEIMRSRFALGEAQPVIDQPFEVSRHDLDGIEIHRASQSGKDGDGRSIRIDLAGIRDGRRSWLVSAYSYDLSYCKEVERMLDSIRVARE